jgi:hypothetical protein
MYDIFFISGFQHILQSLHSLSCFDAGQTLDVAPNQGWSLVITLELLGHEACASWSTIGALNRMTKLSGLSDHPGIFEGFDRLPPIIFNASSVFIYPL